MNVLKQIFGRDQSPESATVTCESTVNGEIEFNESGEGNALIMENVDDFLNKDEDKESSLNPTNTEAVQTENITDNGQTNAGAIISNFIPVQKQNEGPEEKLNVKNCDFKALTDDQMITMQKRNDSSSNHFIPPQHTSTPIRPIKKPTMKSNVIGGPSVGLQTLNKRRGRPPKAQTLKLDASFAFKTTNEKSKSAIMLQTRTPILNGTSACRSGVMPILNEGRNLIVLNQGVQNHNNKIIDIDTSFGSAQSGLDQTFRSKIPWSHEEKLKLIELARNHEILWSPTHKANGGLAARKQAMLVLEDFFRPQGYSAADINSQWRNLKDVFYKRHFEYEKALADNTNSSSNVTEPTWAYYHSLKFLLMGGRSLKRRLQEHSLINDNILDIANQSINLFQQHQQRAKEHSIKRETSELTKYSIPPKNDHSDLADAPTHNVSMYDLAKSADEAIRVARENKTKQNESFACSGATSIQTKPKQSSAHVQPQKISSRSPIFSIPSVDMRSVQKRRGRPPKSVLNMSLVSVREFEKRRKTTQEIAPINIAPTKELKNENLNVVKKMITLNGTGANILNRNKNVDSSLSSGGLKVPRLMQNVAYLDKTVNFNRERIPERVYVIDAGARKRLVENIVGSVSQSIARIQQRVVEDLNKVNKELGIIIENGVDKYLSSIQR